MPRCHKALNRSIHETIIEQKYIIFKEIETLRRIKELSTTWTLEDEREIKRLNNEVEEISRQSVALYKQFIVSPERLRNIRIPYRQLSQIWLV